MKLLIIMPALLFTSPALAVPLPKFEFHYEPVEGEPATACSKEQIQDLPDWRVSCATGYGRKSFTAHVVVREHQRKGETGLEILYWVTEPADASHPAPRFHSTTAFLRLRGSSALADFSLSQGVENDFATLVLRWKTPPGP